MASSSSTLLRMNMSYLKRMLIVWGVLTLVVVGVFLLLWNTFYTYVPPNQHLVVIANEGKVLPPGHVLAGPGEKGIQREVLGEGWHFILPIAYRTELKDNTVIGAGKVGIVTALGGTPLPPGRVLAEEGEQGIQRHVLPPGIYRINTHGFKVEVVDAVEIKPGLVGVQQRLLGKPSKGRFAEAPDEQGVLREVLQPGLYFVNTKERKVIPVEVGVYQTTFHEESAKHDTSISFRSKGGFQIKLDCTVEWEVLPEDMPSLVAEYGESNLRARVEQTVIDLQAKTISRDKGADYGVQDFLEGSQREKFQEDFTSELKRVCKGKNVTVHSAFIRNIDIPDNYMKPIRDKQVAGETKLTNEAREATAKTDADVQREEQMVEKKVKEVEFETKRLTASIDIEVDNLRIKTDAEIEKMKAEIEAEIAEVKAEQTKLLGEAEAQVTKLKETAKSSLYQLKMDIFANDGNAFLRYSLSEQLNPQMRLRLFHSGPGTFWTNMDSKGTNLLLPAPAAPVPQTSTAEKAAGGKIK